MPKGSVQANAKIDSHSVISGKRESCHALVDTKTKPSDSTRRKRRSSSTVKDRERSSSQFDTSPPSRSLEKTRRKDEKTKRGSASEQPTSRAGSTEQKTRKKSDVTGTSVRRIKAPTPLSSEDALGLICREKSRWKFPRELGEERQEMTSRKFKNKTFEIPMTNDLLASARVFEDTSGGFNCKVVRKPSLKSVEDRSRRQQVEDGADVDTSGRGRARSKMSSNGSNDLLIPKPCDDPPIEPLMDTELRNKSLAVPTEMINSVVTGGNPKPREIPSRTDVTGRPDLDALRDMDRKLSALLNLETQGRLRQTEKLRPTLDVLVIPQSCDTSMSGISMDDLELIESLFKESFLDLGSFALPFVNEHASQIDVELVEASEVPSPQKERGSQRKSSLRRSASCKVGMSTPDEVKPLYRRRSVRRSESEKTRMEYNQPIVSSTKELPRAITMEAKNDESYEIPLRDGSASNDRLRKAARARRECRKSSSKAINETRPFHPQDRGSHKHDTAPKGRGIRSNPYCFELHIPQHCDAPVSAISMNDPEWVDELYAKSILG